jgi:uncharacterized membrane protein
MTHTAERRRNRGRRRRDDPTVEDDTEEGPLVEAVAGLTIGALLLTGFALLFSGYPYFWLVWAVGFPALLPVTVGLAKYYEGREREAPATPEPTSDTDQALQVLRERYARGDIDEETFERRLELLLETESVADVDRYVAARQRRADRERVFDPAHER